MASSNKIESILIPLDCILDTRMGTLSLMGDEHVRRNLTPAYLSREHDVFEGVDTEEFNRRYAARDVETLKRSSITQLTTMLAELADGLSQVAASRPYYDGIKIVVNLHPYKLEPEVITEIGKSVTAWVGGHVPVELVSIRPEDLTPAQVKSNYAMMYMYDYTTWMEMHSKAFEMTRLPEVQLVAPALYFNKRPDEKTLHELVRESTHPFVAMTMYASTVVGLELIDAKYFSLAAPIG